MEGKDFRSFMWMNRPIHAKTATSYQPQSLVEESEKMRGKYGHGDSQNDDSVVKISGNTLRFRTVNTRLSPRLLLSMKHQKACSVQTRTPTSSFKWYMTRNMPF